MDKEITVGTLYVHVYVCLRY